MQCPPPGNKLGSPARALDPDACSNDAGVFVVVVLWVAAAGPEKSGDEPPTVIYAISGSPRTATALCSLAFSWELLRP